MKKVKAICMALLAMVVMASCRGPQGPQGPQGNANVASSTVTIHSNDWYWDNNTSWRVDIDYRAITEDITDYGAVLVYMESGTNNWRQVPLTFYYSAVDSQTGQEGFYSSSIEVASYDEGVSIFWTENDFFNGYRPDEHRFKIVVIAVSLYESRSDVDYSNYEAVMKAFQLEDKTER